MILFHPLSLSPLFFFSLSLTLFTHHPPQLNLPFSGADPFLPSLFLSIVQIRSPDGSLPCRFLVFPTCIHILHFLLGLWGLRLEVTYFWSLHSALLIDRRFILTSLHLYNLLHLHFPPPPSFHSTSYLIPHT